MKFSIGSDHAGFTLKEELKAFLESQGYSFIDCGTFSAESTDYPKFAHIVAGTIEQGTADLGILICGSANGVAMTANKHQNVRCAICWSIEIAELARAHNNANVLALPARFISAETAKEIVSKFISTGFEGGRHVGRVDLIACS
jgi:ribose 5-phosphate isomerase B